MAFIARKFAFQHPLFGRSKIQKSLETYKNSVYYLWWEFLRRNEAYKKCCASKGRGKLGWLYEDFGDVHATGFKEWWTTDSKGSHLFAEQVASFKIQTIKSQNDLIINDIVLNVQVPLFLPKRFLIKEFNKILKQHHSGQRGIRTNANSSALYPIQGHVDTAALQKCLYVYDTKLANPNLKLWELGNICKITKREHLIKTEENEPKKILADKKRILSASADKLLRKARKIIDGTAYGKFPVLK